MAAFDALTGPVLSPYDDVPGDDVPRDDLPRDDIRRDDISQDDVPGASEPGGDTPDEKQSFRADFGNGDGLPSRKPLKSWALLEAASVVDSPADGLFGAHAEKAPFRSSLGAAFGAGEPPDVPPGTPEERTEEPSEKRTEESAGEPADGGFAARDGAWGSAEWAVNPTEGGRFSTSAELRAALWEPVAAPYELPSVVPGEWIIGPVQTGPGNEASATFGEWSHDTRGEQGPPSGAADVPSGASAELHRQTAPIARPADAHAPLTSTATPTTPAAPTTASTPVETPTYDEPIGPQPRPEGLPRRGERSATTIASLLTEALAAYQSTADEEDEPHRGPERFDWDPTTAGRHRSPE
jgi:cell division septation protein DedD